MNEASMEVSAVAETIRHLQAHKGRRVIVGFAGPPGSGKSTVVNAVADAVGGDRVAIVPMDGFHLASRQLAGTPLADRRGAIDTFDLDGYVNLLTRLRANTERVVYAPDFERLFEEPIAGAIAIPETTSVVITEGNYLLVDEGGWKAVGELLDLAWYIDTPHTLRIERLVRRHVEFGKSLEAATAWATGPDERNAEFVHSTRTRADHTLQWS